MTNQNRLTKDFIDLTKKYREAQNNPENYELINNISKKIRLTFQKIRTIGDSAKENLFIETKNQPIEISSFIATYLLKYKTNESLKILKKASERDDHIGYGAKQTIARWNEGDWQLD